MNILINIILILSSLVGFCLAYYIFKSKKSGQKMVCPAKSSCEVVVYSKYSKFFGIPLEILGLLYYGILLINYVFFIIVPFEAHPLIVFAVLLSSTLAFFFSLYLAFIQIFNLKQWCIWCLSSSLLCLIIFIFAILGSGFDFVKFLTEYYNVIVVFHMIGVSLGFGGAIIVDILFLKFLEDFKISKLEADIMHLLSQVIWCALAVLIISGIGFYIVKTNQLNHSPKFLAKMVVVFIIAINGALLNLLVAPHLMEIPFDNKSIEAPKKLHRLRRVALALGAISMTSWITASVLGIVRKVDLGFLQIISIYLVLLLIAITVSQFMDRRFSRKS